MRSADSVLETLRRGAPEESLRAAAIRLENAIRVGHGHIVVLGQSHHEAASFVDSVLDRLSGYDVAQISARHGQAALKEPAPNRVSLIVIHDAECADSATLEDIRLALEHADALDHVRFILVGSVKLEKTLAANDTRALQSRVGTTIRLVRKAGRKHSVPIVHRATPLHWALMTSAATAFAALTCIFMTDLSPLTGDARMLDALSQQITTLAEAAVHTLNPLGSTATSAAAHDGGTSIIAQSPSVKAAGTAQPPAGVVTTLAAGFAGWVENAAYAAHVAPRVLTRSAPPTYQGGRLVSSRPSSRVRMAAAAPVKGLVAAVSRLFASDAAAASSGGADGALETALMSRGLRPHILGKRNVIQIGSFSRSKSAFELKSTLADEFDTLAVARFDRPTGPVYSVRIFDSEHQSPQVSAAGR